MDADSGWNIFDVFISATHFLFSAFLGFLFNDSLSIPKNIYGNRITKNIFEKNFFTVKSYMALNKLLIFQYYNLKSQMYKSSSKRSGFHSNL